MRRPAREVIFATRGRFACTQPNLRSLERLKNLAAHMDTFSKNISIIFDGIGCTLIYSSVFVLKRIVALALASIPESVEISAEQSKAGSQLERSRTAGSLLISFMQNSYIELF
jgi:hypothetical protein